MVLRYRSHLQQGKHGKQNLKLIKRTVRGTSNKDVIKKLYIHMVRPHLEYACEVWSPHQEYLKD